MNPLHLQKPLADCTGEQRWRQLLLGILDAGPSTCMPQTCTASLTNMLSTIHFDTHFLAPAFQAVPAGSKVAVIGDGKLGLLVAQVLALQRSLKDSQSRIWHFGRHAEKLQLVKETETEVVQDNDTIKEKHGQVSSFCTMPSPACCLAPLNLLCECMCWKHGQKASC